MKQRVLITGSSGMLGIDLCQELKRDYNIIGMDVLQTSRGGFNLPYIMGDITDKIGIAAIVTKVSPDIVIHCAALTDVDGCELNSKKAYKVNSKGAENIALACKEAGAVLVYISTDFVFDGKKRIPYREDDKTNPLSVYGASKLRGEKLIKKNLSNYYILRTSWLYGKYGKNFVDTIVAKGKTGSLLRVVRDQVGSPTYTKDLARAIHRLLDKPAPKYGTYHISNSGNVSWYDYAREILKLARCKAKVLPITSAELDRPAKRPAMSVMDNSKFTKLTGYKMPGWKKALKEYLLSQPSLQ